MFQNGIGRVQYGIDLNRDASTQFNIETYMFHNGNDRVRFGIVLDRGGSP